MRRLALPMLAAALALACAVGPRADPELDPLLRLIWTEPSALVEGRAIFMPNNRTIQLTVAIEDRVVMRHPELHALRARDSYEWTLESGEGMLMPSGLGPTCRYLPRGITAEEPVRVRVRLTRTYRDGGGVDRTATATGMARIVAPASGELLDAEGFFQGFEIGIYPDAHDREFLQTLEGNYDWVHANADRFEVPLWFYPVTEESRDWLISPHLRLGEFVLDHTWFSLGMPQWVAIDPSLVSKLEDLAALMHESGFEFDRFTLIYGFRSPSYNLGRIERDAEETLKSPFSQHMYGHAVDLIIDADNDQRLDDLNGDGEITVRDAAVIMSFINALDRHYRSEDDTRVGGAGLYDHHDFFERPVLSPYTHLDVRGFLRENDTLYRWPSNWHDTGEPIRWGEM